MTIVSADSLLSLIKKRDTQAERMIYIRGGHTPLQLLRSEVSRVPGCGGRKVTYSTH